MENEIQYVNDDENNLVSRESVPVDEARRVVAEMCASGREASWAPDCDDRARAWVYVTR